MDIRVIKNDQKSIPELNPTIANGFSYERMKGATEYIDNVLRSAFETLKPIGFSYRGYKILPLYESLEAMSRTCRKSSKRALEITHTSSFPISCKIDFTDPVTHAQRSFRKNTHITYLRKGNIFTNNGSKYIVSPKLGDRVFSLDNDSIFVSISRSRMVFIRTPYFFNLDGRIVSTDIHRAKLYYDAAGKTNDKTAPHAVPTLVNYMLCEHGLTDMFKKLYDTDIMAMHEDDPKLERYINDSNFTVCRSHGKIKAKNVVRTNIAFVLKSEQMTLELMHVLASTFFVLDNHTESPGLELNNLDNTTGWSRALASWAIEENDEFAAVSKIESHIDSVKSYIDEATVMRFNREGYKINSIFDLFQYVICNFPVIAATHNVASMEDKVLSIVPHFMFKLTSSIFRMMFELQKQASKKSLTCQQVEKLLQSTWKEEAALSRITSESNVRNLDHASSLMLVKATRLVVPQALKGPGSKKMAEMNDPAFAHHYSKVGIISYGFINKSCPTAIDSLNPTVRLGPGDVVLPHENAIPIRENIRQLTESKSTLKK